MCGGLTMCVVCQPSWGNRVRNALANEQPWRIQFGVRRRYLPESYWRRFCPRCCRCEWSRCWLQHLFSWQRSWAANASAGCWPGWRSAGRQNTLSFFFFDWGQCLLVPTIKKFIQVHFPEINWKQVIPLYSKCMETTLCPIMLFSSLSVWRNQGGNVLIMANKTTLQPMSHDGSGNEFQLIVKPQSPVRVGVCFPNRAKNYFF